jgi:hypothetical protein
MIKFIIEIEGQNQPDLIESLDEARKILVSGGCHLNMTGSTNVYMKPATEKDENEFRRQFSAAHPKPAAPWKTQ